MVDMQRLDEVMVHIHAHPESWCQSTWGGMFSECGTIGCVAGWTGYLATGWEPVWFECGSLEGFMDPDGELWSPAQAARELLNLSEDESRVLFGGANTLEDLDAMWKDFANHGTVRTTGTTRWGDPYRSLSESVQQSAEVTT